MNWQALTHSLFGNNHSIQADDNFLHGQATFDGKQLTVIGTTNHAPIGVALALAQASAVLRTVKEHPTQPILLLIDTQGQQLRRRDELLGIHRAMAHLGGCLDLARRRGQLTDREQEEWDAIAGTDERRPGWLLLLARGVVTPGGDPLPARHSTMVVDSVTTAFSGDRDASREKLGGFW